MTRQPLARAARGAPLGLAGAGLAALPVIYLLNPNTTHVPLCPFHAITGLNCPLCGATRATYALMHGQLATALQDNALYVLGLPGLMLLWWRWSEAARAPASADSRRRRVGPAWLGPAALALGLLFTVARNLPLGSFLSPPT
jgi:hypothetical protein